jgi:hypothetical protein
MALIERKTRWLMGVGVLLARRTNEHSRWRLAIFGAGNSLVGTSGVACPLLCRLYGTPENWRINLIFLRSASFTPNQFTPADLAFTTPRVLEPTYTSYAIPCGGSSLALLRGTNS